MQVVTHQWAVQWKLSRYLKLAKYGVTVPEDFLSLAIKAMSKLKCSGRTNVLYSIAKGIGTPRENGDNSRLPTKRMPMGMIEYVANFVVASTIQEISVYQSDISLSNLSYLVYMSSLLSRAYRAAKR